MIINYIRKFILLPAICSSLLFMPACRTAAYKAAVNGDASAMQELVDDGACVNEKNAMAVPLPNPPYILLAWLPTLLFSICWDIGTLGTFGAGSLTERIVSAPDSEDPICEACKRGHTEVTRILLRKGERPSNNAIFQAAVNNHADTIQLLIEHNIIGGNWQKDGWPLLMWTARKNAADVVKLLIRNDGFVNYTSDKGWTPLYLAAYNGGVESARYLIAANANIMTVLNLAEDDDDDAGLTVIKTLQRAGVPPSIFAQHHLYGHTNSCYALAITKAGSGIYLP